MEVKFHVENGKISFSIPGNPELESEVREVIKKQTAKESKAFYFKLGITDAVNSVLNQTVRLGSTIIGPMARMASSAT